MKYILILIAFALTMGDLLMAASEVESKTLLIKNEKEVTVSFNLWFNFGSANDPIGKEGLASIVAEILTDGSTTKNSYNQILDKLYPIAAGYDSKVDKDMTVIRGRTHIDNLRTYWELYREALLAPAFKQEDLERIKKQRLDYIEKTLRYANDEELGKAVLYGEIFEFTRYGHLAEGTVSSIKSITIDDVKNFYKKYFTRSNYILGLAGNFSDAFVLECVTSLNNLPKGEPSVVNIAPKPLQGLEVTIVEKKNAATAISFGYPISVLRNDSEFVPLAIFNSWFGEHRNQSSHLYEVIREKRGLNYGDYSYIEAFLNGGSLQMPDPNNARRNQIFEVWIRPVQHKYKHFALRAAMRELQNIVNNGLTQSEFEKTKNFLSKYCLNYTPTLSARLGYSIDNMFYGLADNQNYTSLLSEKIKRTTLEQVNISIMKHLQYKNMKIVIVTSDAEQLKKDLLENVPSPITYENEKPKAILEEDKEIANFPISINPNKIKIIKVEDCFEK
jgi:zinc protease